jgi:hypothetical protein
MDFAMDTVTDSVITNVHQNQRRAEPIPKPKGNYVDVPGACGLSKSKLKEYQVNFLWFLLINRIIYTLLIFIYGFRIIYVIWLSFTLILIRNIKDRIQKR